MRKFIFICLLLQNTYLPAQDLDYTDVLSNYIQYPSTRGNESEAGKYIYNLCREAGLETAILTQNEDSIYNFIVSLYPLSEDKPNYIFLNHIDVVEPGDTAKWTFPPFSGIISGGYVWGRGAIDNKGMAVAQFAALYNFSLDQSVELPFNVSVLFVSGEETDGSGARYVMNHHKEELNARLIIGEGGSGVTGIISSDPNVPVFGISTSEKSRLVLDLELSLKTSGHTSIPPKEYAIKEMVEALENLTSGKNRLKFNKLNKKSLRHLGKAEKGIKGFMLRHNSFPLFRPFVVKEIKEDPEIAAFFSNTISISNISVPELEDNQFPGTVTATLDCRLLPETKIDRFISCIRRKIKDDRININVSKLTESPGRTYVFKYFDLLSQSIDIIYPTAENIEIIFPATSDNSLFRSHGINVFGVFPCVFSRGELESIHNVDERISIEAFYKAIQVYEEFLDGLKKLNKDSGSLSLLNTQ